MAMPDVTWAGNFFRPMSDFPKIEPKSYSSGTMRTAPLSALVAKAA
jgi:hypothetical protein